jgi:hypothetical protein
MNTRSGAIQCVALVLASLPPGTHLVVIKVKATWRANP